MAKKKEPHIWMNYHRLCFRTIRYCILEYDLPLDFTPENDIDDQAKRYDILLTRTGANNNDKTFLASVRDLTVGEFKNHHIRASYHEFLQTLHYALHEYCRMLADPRQRQRGLTAMMLCSGIGRGLTRVLKSLGMRLENQGNGIYNVIGVPGIDDFRIVVLSKLKGNEHACFRIICENASVKDIVLFLRQAERHRDDSEAWRWIDEILAACMQMNPQNYLEAMMEVEKMNGFDKERFERLCWSSREKQILDARNEGRIEGRNEGRIEGRNEGRIEGRNEGRIEGRNEVTSDLLGIMKNGILTVEQLLNYQKSFAVHK